MNPRFLPLAAMLCALTLAGSGTPAGAGSITRSTNNCMPLGQPHGSLLHMDYGTGTATFNDLYIVCSIPRSPLTTVGSGLFRVTGMTAPSREMPCTVNSFDYTGVFLGSATFVVTYPTDPQPMYWAPYVREVSLPQAQLPYWAYTSLICHPPAGLGIYIRSITSVHDQVSAANINTQATPCQTTNPDKTALIIHDVNGVRTTSQATTPLAITCSIPRSPLDPTRSFGFYVDGDNVSGAVTECFISSYDYTGTFLGSASFSTSSAQYDMWLSLPQAMLSSWAYTSLTCYLPPNGQGVLRGVTSVQ